MKNKSFIYGMMLLGAVSFTGCTDMLEKEPLDSFTNNPQFWNNPASVEGYAAKFYNLYTGYGNTVGLGDFYAKYLSDDQVGATFQTWKFTNAASNSSDWSSSWEWIRHANVMIEELNVAATEMDQTTKNHWLGVARLMRGWQYWDLVRKFGDCPWVDHAPDVTDPLLYAAREDRDMIMDKVYEDLDFACKNIEEATAKTTWSRNLAYAMTSQICLWEGTFRKYRTEADNGKAPDLEGAKKFLQKCVEVDELLMPQYSLCSDYKSLYNSTSEELAVNPEIIFYKEYKKDIFMHSLIDYTCSTTQMSGMSKDAFDSYLFLDGKTAESTSYNNTDVPQKALSANDGAMHLNLKPLMDVRDKRLSQTIDSVLCYPGNPWPRVSGGMLMTSSTGYGVSKYDDVEMGFDYRQNTGKNYTSAPLYWLAVIYLDYAEAKAELASMGVGDFSGVLAKSVNLLKQRAGLPDLADNPADLGDNDMGVSPLIWEIRRERRCELMFDNDFRYWDLIRWHQLDKLDPTKNPDIMYGANLNNSGNDFDATKVALNSKGYIDGYTINGESFKDDRKYDKKHYLYPIPTDQIVLNPKLGQNPGWGSK